MLSDLYFNHLLRRMESFHGISPGFIKAMRPLLEIIEAAKGTRLLSCGQRPSRVWYIIKGFAKEISHESGEGHVSWFWSEGDFVYAYPGFFSQGVAVNDIEVIDDSVLIGISYEKFMQLNLGFPEVPLLVEKIRDHHDRMRFIYTCELSNMKAADRFKKFIAANRGLFLVAKRGDIARFLGIKDNSLRRYG